MRTNVPDAFLANLPKVKPTDEFRSLQPRPTQCYKAGKLHIAYSPAHNEMPAIMVVNHPDRYPTWDEVVWARYNVAPDVVDFAMILPPLAEYINYTDGRAKNTFTLEEVTHRGRS